MAIINIPKSALIISFLFILVLLQKKCRYADIDPNNCFSSSFLLILNFYEQVTGLLLGSEEGSGHTINKKSPDN